MRIIGINADKTIATYLTPLLRRSYAKQNFCKGEYHPETKHSIDEQDDLFKLFP
jgi:hypothetical protein